MAQLSLRAVAATAVHSSARPQGPTATPRRRTPLRSEAAYDELLPELLAVPDAQLLPVDVDVMAAITTVCDALPGLFELGSDVAPPASEQRPSDQPGLCVEELERLEQYALALGHAHLLYCGAFSPALDVTLLAAELSKVRDGMLAHAEALAASGLIDGQRLRRIALRSALHSAHRAVAGDVIALCAVFRDHWPQLEAQTPYTLEEQHRLVRLSLDLMAALGAREPASGLAGESARLRQRAFTLFARCYERVRAAVSWLRVGAPDADVLAPPLHGEPLSRSWPATPPQPPASVAAAPPPLARAASPAQSQPAGKRG